jgi:endonuclease YncB( thermonuclease family)
MRHMLSGLVFSGWAALAALALGAPDARADEIVGAARVINGDTLVIEQQRVRLYGIDAPETKQRCWASGIRYNCADQAKATLAHLTRDKDVKCRLESYDAFGQFMGTCTVGALEINRELVRQGWALAYRQFTLAYADDEADAERRKAGLWMGEFETPWDWRTKNGEPPG